MSQLLGVVAALAEDLDLVPVTNIRMLTTPVTAVPGNLTSYLVPQGTRQHTWCIYIYLSTHVYT